MDAHEKHKNRGGEIQGGSNRSFGIVFMVVFLLLGGYPLLDGAPPLGWALVTGLVFGLLAGLFPAWLGPLNRLWTRFGLLLSRIVNPIIMAGIFFLAVTPTGWIMRLMGKDPLRLKWEKDQASYWIPRDPPGPDPESLSNQF